MTEQLSSMPNIGIELQKKLNNVGINTPEQLKSTGSKQAFMLISGWQESACYNMLMALEGAIQGIRWHGLDTETKEELKELFNMVKKDQVK